MAEQIQQNNKIIKRLLLLVVGMFGFGFAMVPIYDVFCEITGINGKPSNVAAVYEESQIDLSREITIQFVASVKRGMPWEFKPEVSEMKVHPGQVYKTSFYAKNLSNKKVTGQAIPSVAPGLAAIYMNKTECFCFNQQHLNGEEEIDMPLVFFIDKDIPDDIRTLSLSYSLFNITEQIEESITETNTNNKTTP
jgi:cytochrome c oxidase assembly protein subunit 11